MDSLPEYIEPEWSGLYPATISAVEFDEFDSQPRDTDKIFDPSAIDFATLMRNVDDRLAEENVPIHVCIFHAYEMNKPWQLYRICALARIAKNIEFILSA